MTLRLSTSLIYQNGMNALLDNQGRLSYTQMQLSTGRRILSPSDDPSGAVQALELRRAIDTTNQYQENIDLASTRLRLEESTLGSVNDNLQRVRELAVQASNDTQDDTTRAGLAVEIGERLSELFSLANTRDSNGEYIFAGYRSQGEPFVRTAAGFVYNGDDGQRFLQVSPVRQVAIGDSGTDVFYAIPDGNGTFSTAGAAGNTGTGVIDSGTVNNLTAWVPDDYTISFTGPTSYDILDGGGATIASGTYRSGDTIAFNGVQVTITGTPSTGDAFSVSASAPKDLFSMVQDLQTLLTTPTTTGAEQAQFHSRVNRSLTELNQAMDRILTVRADVGGRMNALDSQQAIHEAAAVSFEQNLSEVQDLDYAEAISRFNQQLVTLQAAQQTYVKVQGLSLFNYIA